MGERLLLAPLKPCVLRLAAHLGFEHRQEEVRQEKPLLTGLGQETRSSKPAFPLSPAAEPLLKPQGLDASK